MNWPIWSMMVIVFRYDSRCVFPHVNSPWPPSTTPSHPGVSATIFFSIIPSSNPGRCHGSQASLCPNSLLNSSILIFPLAEAARAIPQSGCRWSTCGNGRNPCSDVSIEAATGLFPNVHSGYISTISSSRSTPRYAFSSASSFSIYSVANPARLMLPRSPPLPFTHRICFVFPSSGSTCSSFELVLPPPKFVIRRSEPSRFDRYLKSSGASSFAAAASSQRSSRNRRPLFVVICKPLSYPPNQAPIHHSTPNINTATISNVKNPALQPTGNTFLIWLDIRAGSVDATGRGYLSVQSVLPVAVVLVRREAGEAAPQPSQPTPVTPATRASPSYGRHSYTAAPSAHATATAPDESGSAHTSWPHATPTRSAATGPSASPQSPPRCSPAPRSPRACPASALALHPPHSEESSPRRSCRRSSAPPPAPPGTRSQGQPYSGQTPRHSSVLSQHRSDCPAPADPRLRRPPHPSGSPSPPRRRACRRSAPQTRTASF